MAGIPKDTPQFRDGSGWTTVVKAPYVHKSEFKGEKPFPQKADDGRIIIEDRNFQTNPKAKLLHKFANVHMKDEYDRFEKQQRQLRQKSASMRLGGSFRSMHGPNNTFNKVKNVYGTDKKFPERKVGLQGVGLIGEGGFLIVISLKKL